MKKESIVAIISIVAIVATVAYSGLNFYAVNNLKFKWHTKDFKLFSMTGDSQLETCNALPFPATFKKYDIELQYQSNKLGTYSAVGATLAPSSSSILVGKFTAGDFGETLVYLMYLDTEMSGNDIARIDARQLHVFTKLDTSFLGVIPFSITKEYSGLDFVKMMNQQDSNFGCSK